MTTISGLFLRQFSTKELCVKLAPLLEDGESSQEVKCTKRIYSSLFKHLNSEVIQSQYESVCILFKTLSHIARTSTNPASGFHKFITFGLPDEILSLCEALFTKGHGENWRKMTDTVLFSLTEILTRLNDTDVKEMVPLLIPLLKCVCNSSLPCSAQIEAARGSNTLLEACSDECKTVLTRRPEINQLIMLIGKSIHNAGNFELQVSMVECLYRMTSTTERLSLAQKWFGNTSSSLIKNFTSIREAEFEVDCRLFLNELNSNTKEKTVYSLSCMRLFCGEFELHCPHDESLSGFWVDFNTGSSSVTVFVEDPIQSDSQYEDSVWEMITIKESVVSNWTVKVQGGDFVLTISLKNHAHTLLPSIPPLLSHDVTFRFNSVCDPTHPTKLALGARKQTTKQSSAINAVHIKSNSRQTHPIEISPIEAPPDTPVQGEQVNSQGSNITPTNTTMPATPATSTPKGPLKHLLTTLKTPTHTTPSQHPSLMFVSNGKAPKRERPKASTAVNAILLATGKATVIQTVKENYLEHETMELNDDKSENMRNARGKLMSKMRPLQNESQQTTENYNSKLVKKRSSTECTRQAPDDLTTPAGRARDGTSGRKQLSQLANFRNLQSPEDSNSPILNYAPTSAVQKKLQPQVRSTTDKETVRPSSRSKPLQSKLKTSIDTKSQKPAENQPKKSKQISGKHKTALPVDPYELPIDDIPANGDTSMASVLSEVSNSPGKQRKFNLSGVSMAHAKKSKLRKNSKPASRDSSFNSTHVSETMEPLAIPDSLPTGSQHEKLPPQNCAVKSKGKQPLALSRGKSSLNYEDNDELDQSWEPSKENREIVESCPGKTSKSRKPATKQSARKRTINLSTKSSKQAAKSKTIAKPAMKFESQSAKHLFIDEVYGDFTTPDPDPAPKKNQKRIIDDVYNSTEIESEAPRTKVTKSASTTQRKKTNQLNVTKAPEHPSRAKPVKSKRTVQPTRTSKQIKQVNIVKPIRSSPRKYTQAQKKKPPSKPTKPLLNSAPKSYQSKGNRKRPVLDHNDFDDLMLAHLQSKKHCSEHGNKHVLDNTHSPSPIMLLSHKKKNKDDCQSNSPESNKDDGQSNSPVAINISPVYISSSPSSYQSEITSEISSVQELVKNKVLNTEVTEKARVPNSPQKTSKESLPPSPSVSIHSSLITADVNITAGFQQICQDLISNSGSKLGVREPKKVTATFQAKGFPKSQLESINGSEALSDCELSDSEPTTIRTNHDHPITLTQLTRDIVNSHNKTGSKRRQLQTKTTVKKPIRNKAIVLPKKKMIPSLTPMVVEEVAIDVNEDILSLDDDSTSASAYSHIKSPDVVSTLSGDEDCEPGSASVKLPKKSSGLCDLEKLFGARLHASTKGTKQRKSIKSQSNMLQLWRNHQEQRNGTLTVYRDQLYKELEVLERDLQQTQNSERQTLHLMKKGLRNIHQSIGSQQTQVDRIRTLQVSFQQYLGEMEENQQCEQVGAHRTLKQEMHSLHKKLLTDYERNEVSQIKKSLHAMLLQQVS